MQLINNQVNSAIAFDLQTIQEYNFGGVYVIEAISSSGESEIVKIGQSSFVYRRLANYLNPFKSDSERNNPKRVTKRRIQEEMKKGKMKGLTYRVSWIVENDVLIRKRKERELLVQFRDLNNGKLPIMNGILN
jgi:hypothetical protein